MLRQVVTLMTKWRDTGLRIEWIPTRKMVADALAKLMEASMLRAFLSAAAFKATPPLARSAASAATLVLGTLASLPGARAEVPEPNYVPRLRAAPDLDGRDAHRPGPTWLPGGRMRMRHAGHYVRAGICPPCSPPLLGAYQPSCLHPMKAVTIPTSRSSSRPRAKLHGHARSGKRVYFDIEQIESGSEEGRAPVCICRSRARHALQHEVAKDSTKMPCL